MGSIKSSTGRVLWAGLAVLVLGGGAFAAFALMNPRPDPIGIWDQTDNGVAISGYDTVAYFTDGKPAKGDSIINYAWQDTTWYFANRRHRDMFAASPEQYAPEFGGFCAGAMTFGMTTKADPEVWAIVDGKLYLNYDNYTQELFHENLKAHIAKAEAKWAEKIEAEADSRARTSQAG